VGAGGQAKDSLSYQRNLVNLANRSSREVNPLEFCSVVTGVWEPLQVGAAGQINRLEVSNVAKGVWVPLQVGATRQVNRLEARQAAKD